jgi:hypothetical protein
MTTTTRVQQCGVETSVGDRTFSCIASPHPASPNQHYFAVKHIDDQEPIINVQRPTHTTAEANLEDWFRDKVRKLTGGMIIKLAPMQAGIPDRLVMLPGGHLYLVELKVAGGGLSEIQRHWHARLARLGIKVVVLTGRDECLTWITAYIDKSGPKTRAPRS